MSIEIMQRWAEQALQNKITKFIEGLVENASPKSEELLIRIVASDAESSYDYAAQEMRRKYGWGSTTPFRWEPGEKAISKDAGYSCRYARELVQGRWEPGEEAISKSAQYSCEYARDVIGGRWEPGEEAISKSAGWSCTYAELLGGRFILGEEAISKDGAKSYEYARDIVKGRWEDGEEAISEDSELMYLYAKDVFKGRLPDELHNKMVMLSFSEPDEFVNKYCGAKKYMVNKTGVHKKKKIAS